MYYDVSDVESQMVTVYSLPILTLKRLNFAAIYIDAFVSCNSSNKELLSPQTFAALSFCWTVHCEVGTKHLYEYSVSINAILLKVKTYTSVLALTMTLHFAYY
jgi:hypothetical protein